MIKRTNCEEVMQPILMFKTICDDLRSGDRHWSGGGGAQHRLRCSYISLQQLGRALDDSRRLTLLKCLICI